MTRKIDKRACRKFAMPELEFNLNEGVLHVESCPYIKRPKIEHLIKMKLYRLVSGIIYGGYSYSALQAINFNGENMRAILGIDRPYFPLLRELNPSIDQLHLIRQLLQADHKPSTEQIKWFIASKISNADAAKELLAHMSVHKLQRYVEQQFAPEDEAALKRVDYYKMNTLITDYHDYLCMCKELQYDVKNSFILFPRELKAAHDSVAKTLKDKRTAEQEKAIAGSFDEWQKRYQYQSKELMMIPPHSAKEIVDEGAALHHCVRLYVKNVAEKKSVILFVRSVDEPDKSLCTVEVKDGQVMGVDVHTDVRLNNGKDSVLTSFLNYADFDEGYFAHSNTTPKNAMATYQGCYATQWYLGFLNGGGAGHPYSLYYHRFDFSRKLSTEADITSFTLEGKQGVFTTEGRDNIITVTLPAGTPLNDMHPQLQLSDYATILAPDLTGGITFVKDTKTAFTVQAEDGKTTKTYYVVVKLSDEEKPSGAEIYTDTIMLKDANILRDLDILGKNITAGTDSTDIELLLDAGKDTSNLMIYARLSYGATASPALDGKKGMNLSDWTTFTITSGDGTNTRTYRIKATARTQASISAFSLTIGGTVYEGVIDDKANTITVSGVDDSNLSSTSFAPDVTLGPETLVCSPAPGLAQDFSRTVQYIVAGNEKVLSRTYTVSVLNKAGKLISGSGGGGGSDPVTPATGAKITAFSVLGVDGVINQSVGTITVTLPAGTNVTAVAPSVTVTAGAVVSPVSGEVVNLTAPVVYTVTLGEETSRYTVTVTFERSVSQQLWDELGNNSDVADHQTSHTKRDWS